MINKTSIKKIIIPGIALIFIAILGFFIVSTIQNKKYEKIVNETISNFIDEIMEKYPETSEEDIIKILNDIENTNEQKEKMKILKKYGYTNNLSYIKKLENEMYSNMKFNIVVICVFGILILTIVLIYNRKKEREIKKINKYLNEINNGNYELKIEENCEDELSKLKNELYKTTVLLRETAENSEQEKINLSNSLADISHQIKTPLTSIRIMLDNIEDNPDMDRKTREEFIEDISKQIDWISSLAISLLKLAKFDAGAIKMNDQEVNVKKLINNVISNLAILLDIKNIKIEQKIDDDTIIKADYNWQLEALTNIIKNAIEHSHDNGTIHIDVENNSVFVKIKIRDEGEGIDKKDIKHIFDRFYKAKKSSENSIGIGLSLAKTIIEQENGYIKVDSETGKGTTFEIKYLK